MISTEPLRVAIVGAAGRMGTELLALVDADSTLSLGAAIDRAPGDDTSGIAECDVVVDFSTPSGCAAALRAARAARCAFVTGTTGLDEPLRAALADAASEIAVLSAANFSAGVHVLAHLVELGARALGDFDVEIFEAHHRRKVDAPSGTALFLGEAVRTVRPDAQFRHAREGLVGPRSSAEIGFQVLRGGSIVGEHTVMLCGEGERLELTHRAQDRAIFARGALRAAKWLASRAPGTYEMRDVLELR